MKKLIRPILPLLLAVSLALPASAFLFSQKESESPVLEAFSKNGLAGQSIQFSATDFASHLSENAELDGIVITSLPETGVLRVGDLDVGVGSSVAVSALGGLAFYPPQGDVSYASFTVLPVFSDGSAAEPVSIGVHLLTAQNSAPVAENMELRTYKNIALTGRLCAVDPEGDALTFRIVDKPARGQVEICEGGMFVYTPYEDKTGKDSFTYAAVDAVGNESAPATVKLRIEKAGTKITYADMDGDAAHCAAIRLAEENVFVGERMGGAYYFRSDLPVTRSEFLATALVATGTVEALDVERTGFADDEEIATWAKPYVAAALKAGIVSGSADASGAVNFAPGSVITAAEASVILDRLLEISDVSTQTVFADSDAAPAWAYQSAVNLEKCGIIQTDTNGALRLGRELTRGEMAEMLVAAMDVLDARESGGVLSWFGL